MQIPYVDGSSRWLILSIALVLATPLAAQDTSQGDRAETQLAYAEFQRLMKQGNYADALRRAQETVQAEEYRHAGNGELSVAYHQLGVAQLRMDDANAARASLQRALQLLEMTEPVASPRFIGPMVDLAEAHATLGAHDEAIATLQQAIVIGRRADGLFSTGQLELMDRIAVSFESVGDFDGVDQVRRYAVLVAEKQFGPDNPGCLPAIEKLTNWFETTGRYGMATSLYERTVRIATLEGSERNVTVIGALMGMARSYRLQYVETPDQVEGSVWGSPPGQQFDPVTGQKKAIAGAVDRPGLDAPVKLDQRGKEALQRSLEILESVADPPRDLLAKTLLEFGDWYQTDQETTRAISYYKRAWPLLEETSTTESPNPLHAPRPMFYRPPLKLRQNRAIQEGPAVQRQVKFKMTITDRGDVSDLARIGGDMSEGGGWQVARALNRATFSPRIENGGPVATTEFEFTEFRFETRRD